MQRLCHPVPYGPMQRLCHPAHFFQSHLTCYLSLCTSATQLMCEPRNVLQSRPRFDFIQLSVSFWNLCSASAIQFPMDLCNAFAIQPISLFLFCCMSKPSQSRFFPWHESSNLANDFAHHAKIQNIQTQIANLKSHIPSFASHSEPHADAKTTLPLYPLSGYSAKFCRCKSCWTPCQLSGSTRCKPTRPKVHKGTLQGQITPQFILLTNSITTRGNATPNVGKWRRQSSLLKPSSSLHSNHWHSCISIRIHPSREVQHGIAALSQKGKTCIQTIFTQTSVSMTTTPEYLPVSGFTSPSLHLSQSLQLHPFQVSHENKLQESKQQKSYLTCLWH